MDVIYTNSRCRSDAGMLLPMRCSVVILDEGDAIKNPATKISKLLKRLRCRHRLIMTGTPIRNSVLDLWSLFEFLMPSYLGSLDFFTRKFHKPIVKCLMDEGSLEINVMVRS